VRYELLCPAKTEIVRLGSLAPTTRATMLPRWGLYKFNSVDPRRLKAPWFQPSIL
jgi:hypothetical protein